MRQAPPSSACRAPLSEPATSTSSFRSRRSLSGHLAYLRRRSMTATTSPREFESLLEYLKQTRGFDFTAYKRSSLMRRVGKRMQAVDIADFAAYQDYLEVHPEEFTDLFNTILINVTGFFRDAGA